MKQVPYVSNPGNACALSCYTMVGQYLFPDLGITFDRFAEIADSKKGYVVWGFSVWKWLMDQGAYAIDYDTIDYEAWAKEGVDGLRRSSSPVEFEFYKKSTYDLEQEGRQVKVIFEHPHFTYVRRRPTWDDVVAEFNKPGICDLTLNSKALNGRDGFTLHRVVLLDISDTEVVFHDPVEDDSGAYRHEPLDHFTKVFESIDGPELARYSLEAI